MRVRFVVAGLGLVVALTPAPEAEACSCSGALFVVPSSETTDVPPNLADIIVGGTSFNFEYSVTLRTATTSVALGAPTQAPSDLLPPVYRIPVLSPLQPSTEYTIEVDGFEPQTFTTTATDDTTPPAAIAFDALRLARAEIVAELPYCGESVVDVDATFSGVDGTAVMDMTIITGSVTQHMYLPYPSGTQYLGNGACAVAVGLRHGVTTCFEVRARDLAGNVGPMTSQCAETRVCLDIDNEDDLQDVNTDPQSCPIAGEGGCSTTRPDGGLLVAVIAALALRRRRRATAR